MALQIEFGEGMLGIPADTDDPRGLEQVEKHEEQVLAGFTLGASMTAIR